MTLADLVIGWLSAGNLGFKTVEGVEAVADIDNLAVAALPGGFVVEARESFEVEQEGAGLIVMRRTFEFDVISLVTASARRGADRGELRTLNEAVILRLMGWTPEPSTYRPIVPIAGQLTGIGGGRASWLTRFRTVDRLRKQG